MNIFNLSTARAASASPLHDEARDWLLLLTSGRATVADAKALKAWCAQSPEHAQAFEQAKVLWHNLQPAAEMLQSPRRFGRRAFLGGAIAASAAFLLVRGTIPGGFVPEEDKGRYHTLSGMVMWLLGRLPNTGDIATWENWRLEVIDLDGKRIDKVLASRLPDTAPADALGAEQEAAAERADDA